MKSFKLIVYFIEVKINAWLPFKIWEVQIDPITRQSCVTQDYLQYSKITGEYKSEFELPKDTPCPALTGEQLRDLWI